MSDDDVFETHEPVVVDFDVLERAKENVQPLATGRRVTALAGLLATPHAKRDAKLSATRNRLRINVEIAMEDEDGDPLEAYCRLVYWTLENYPQGHSAESGLLELLEEATRILKDYKDGIYRNDMKYLKLWLLYASYVERPTIIHKFLLANDIGIGFALLYEEHAAVLERDRRKQEADEVYRLGIARKADPLDHLESRYQDFQRRMISSVTAPSEPETSNAQLTKPKRQALATTLKAPSAASSSRTSGSRPAVDGLSAAAASNRTGFQIFVDPSGEGGELDETENEWHDLGTRKARIKENIPETNKIAGTTIKQAGKTKRVTSVSSRNNSGSKIVPFRDPVNAPDPVKKPAASSKIPTKALTQSSSSTRKPSGKAFVPFTDEETPTPAPAPPKAKAKAFVPFADEAKPVATAPSITKPLTKGLVPFVDGEEASTEVRDPAPPKFVPFRDEDEPEPARSSSQLDGESVIKVKQASITMSTASSEAEALRKDPLKNYDT